MTCIHVYTYIHTHLNASARTHTDTHTQCRCIQAANHPTVFLNPNTRQGGRYCKISYYNKQCIDASQGIDVELDLDALRGGGPETITFKQAMPGDYYVYMDRYTYMDMFETHGEVNIFLPSTGPDGSKHFSLDNRDGVIGNGYFGHGASFSPNPSGRVWYIARVTVGADGSITMEAALPSAAPQVGAPAELSSVQPHEEVVEQQQLYDVKVPPHVKPGQEVEVHIKGHKPDFVIIPPGAKPGEELMLPPKEKKVVVRQPEKL